MAEALAWVSRIVAAAVMMILPGLVGQWLDGRVGTSFLALVGFAVGITSGIWYLLVMTRSSTRAGSARSTDTPPKDPRS